MSKKEFSKEDIAEVYEKLTHQLDADRVAIDDAYTELREMIRGQASKWVDCGETLSRFADLRIKQTAQFLEVLKSLEKIVPEDEFDGQLSEDDRDAINKELQAKDGVE